MMDDENLAWGPPRKPKKERSSKPKLKDTLKESWVKKEGEKPSKAVLLNVFSLIAFLKSLFSTSGTMNKTVV